MEVCSVASVGVGCEVGVLEVQRLLQLVCVILGAAVELVRVACDAAAQRVVKFDFLHGGILRVLNSVGSLSLSVVIY